jgi:hypothetical protein
MKAISLRQPWADLVVSGRKTLELRSWTVSYRGPIAIHASQTVSKEACQAFGIDPEGLTTGAIVGLVELVEIIPIDEQEFVDRKDEHLASGFFEPPLQGWVLSNARQIEPIPYTGRMNLFNIPDGFLNEELSDPLKSAASVDSEPVGVVLDDETQHATHPFELRVLPEPSNHSEKAAYRLALYQRMVQSTPDQRTLLNTIPTKMRLLVELGGNQLRSVADMILETLRQNGYAATDLGISRKEPFRFTEESGVRLALIFLSVRPVTKLARVEDISRGIRSMTREELYYWFSKCTGPTAERAQKALRILLADG